MSAIRTNITCAFSGQLRSAVSRLTCSWEQINLAVLLSIYLIPLYPEEIIETNASNSATRPMRLLSIDGGGLRGLIPAEALIAIETQLDALTGRSLPLSDRFD